MGIGCLLPFVARWTRADIHVAREIKGDENELVV
jgi:hypothetical protein